MTGSQTTSERVMRQARVWWRMEPSAAGVATQTYYCQTAVCPTVVSDSYRVDARTPGAAALSASGARAPSSKAAASGWLLVLDHSLGRSPWVPFGALQLLQEACRVRPDSRMTGGDWSKNSWVQQKQRGLARTMGSSKNNGRSQGKDKLDV